MRPGRRFDADDDEEQEGDNRRTASLAGLAVALLLVVIGLMLVHVLHHESTLEDCLMSGRVDCDVMVPGAALDPP